MLIKIDGTDVTNKVLFDTTFKVKNNINNQVDEFSFKVKSTQLVPEIGKEVEVFNGADKIFAGDLLQITDSIEGGKLLRFNCRALDYANRLKRKIIVERYEDETVSDIISDMVTSLGFTVVNVSYNPLIKTIAFNGISVSECLEKLADLLNAYWYVDYDKDIHFFEKNAEPSPYNLTDTSANYIFDSLTIKDDLTKLKNKVTIRGGLALSETAKTEVRVSQDSTQDTFNLVYLYQPLPVVTVNGTPKDVGLENKEEDTGFDVMWSEQGRYIRFTAGNFPIKDDVIEVTGITYFPVFVQVADDASILAYGDAEFEIKDNAIVSEEQAIERAISELEAYSSKLSDGSFQTYNSGLKSGQILNIQSTLRGIDINVVIQSVETRSVDPMGGQIIYNVEFATEKTVGIIKILQKLLLKEDVIADELEVLLRYITFSESMTMVDEFLLSTMSQNPYYWSNDAETTPNRMIFDFFTWEA